jgi:hypothetical protein
VFDHSFAQTVFADKPLVEKYAPPWKNKDTPHGASAGWHIDFTRFHDVRALPPWWAVHYLAALDHPCPLARVCWLHMTFFPL